MAMNELQNLRIPLNISVGIRFGLVDDGLGKKIGKISA